MAVAVGAEVRRRRRMGGWGGFVLGTVLGNILSGGDAGLRGGGGGDSAAAVAPAASAAAGSAARRGGDF